MQITKADGTQEEFKSRKLEQSLKRAGARPAEARSIVRDVEANLRPGMKSQEIYRIAFTHLRDAGESLAARYSLRRAIFGLGPTGFPFEDFLGRLFEAQGYHTKRRLLLKGKCALHEIDLAAYSPTHSFVAEAKFHARPGIKSDLQVAMYSYARYLDLERQRICKEDVCGIISLMVITNTKFTEAAVNYARCTGIELLSWDQPRDRSLHTLIEQYGTYPITVLTRLSSTHKQALLARGAILCSDLVTTPQHLSALGLPSHKAAAITAEAASLCASLKTTV
jgi:hypothetical protein